MARVMNRQTYLKLAFVLLALGMLLAARNVSLPQVHAATGTICDQFGSTTQNGYVVMNNRWGTSATQCINVTNTGFQITQQGGNCSTSGAPCAYPAIYAGCHYSNCSSSGGMPKQISQISSAPSSVSVSYASGTWDSAYDIWLNADSNVSGVQDTEIMIWLSYQGSVQPVGSRTGSATIDGVTWEVWTGNNGQNNVVSYRTTGKTSINIDVKHFINDTFTRGSQYGNSSWYLTSIQYGFEPWSGGVGLAVNSFSASASGGGSTQPTATRAPQPTATRAPTTGGTQPTATRTATSGTSTGGTCSGGTIVTAPFTFDGSGSKCWQVANFSYINDWNTTSVVINGKNVTNLYVTPSQLPAKINGYYYISYNSSVSYGHLEIR